MRKEQRTSKQETRLRRARIEKGWTLQEASKKVGVSLATYRRWEAGLQKPHLFSLDVLCAVFGMRKEELGFPISLWMKRWRRKRMRTHHRKHARWKPCSPIGVRALPPA